MSNAYKGRGVDVDTLQDTIDAYERCKNAEEAAKYLGVARSTVYYHLKLASQKGMFGTAPVLPGFELSKTTTIRDENGATVREIIQQRPGKGEQFDLPEGHVIKGVSTLVDGDGRTIQQWIKTKEDNLVPDVIAACKAAFADFVPRELIQPPENTDDELLTVYPIGDQHMGLHAWGIQTGEDYDLKIGAERLRNCLQRLVSQSPSSTTGIILNLGDWQHTDDARNVTPGHGNVLDVDNRYQKILQTGVMLMADAVHLALKKHKTVIVRNLPGNHDPHASVALTIALACLFVNNDRVKIDDCPSEFFWHRHGKTLIGATHGHRMKPAEMAMAMATRCRRDWGETDFHHFYFGHIHRETAAEVGDVRVESFQTLASKDAWGHSKGFASGQSITAIHHHVTEGEIGRHRINLPTPYSQKVTRSA